MPPLQLTLAECDERGNDLLLASGGLTLDIPERNDKCLLNKCLITTTSKAKNFL